MTNRGTASVTIAALAFAALIAACSSPAPAAKQPATGISPQGKTTPATRSATPVSATGSCGVITAAEASAALGQPVKTPVLGKAFVEGGRACVYFGPDAPPGAGADVPVADSVRVVLVTGPNARKYFDDYRSKVHARPISGLGDQAFYDGVASVSALKGDAYVRIYCGPAGALGPEEQLVKDALPRM